jgi:hypothetical protein
MERAGSRLIDLENFTMWIKRWNCRTTTDRGGKELKKRLWRRRYSRRRKDGKMRRCKNRIQD